MHFASCKSSYFPGLYQLDLSMARIETKIVLVRNSNTARYHLTAEEKNLLGLGAHPLVCDAIK